MTNPRDFIPAKYKKSQTNESSDFSTTVEADSQETEVKTDSPWSDLAKEPEVPEYRNSETTEEKTTEPKKEGLKLDDKPLQPITPQKTIPKKKSGNKLVGLLVIFFLVIGLASSYLLSQQSQDTRQQAFEPECEPGEPYCSGGRCISGYSIDSNGTCVKDNSGGNSGGGDGSEPTSCPAGYHFINSLSQDGTLYCILDNCKEISNASQISVCGYPSDTDPCTEDSVGGDWCIDSKTGQKTECGKVGLIRCKCAPGSGSNDPLSGYWVIGNASSCDDLCDAADIACPDCGDSDEPDEPNPTTTPEPTATPTSVPVKLSCGETGCNTNSDCKDGFTCQSVSVNNSTQGICALGTNQLFCAADPTVANCCEEQTMPTCASIDILDANNNPMEGNDDENLSVGDAVRFRCSAVGNQGINFNYEFRIWVPGNNYWIDLTDESGTIAKNISDTYIISNAGSYVTQGRICWGNECQTWEIVEGAPNNSRVCYGENAIACLNGEVCSAVPAGGCPTTTVNGITMASDCASVPVCRQAEGIDCRDDNDCFDGYTCYQPPMPTCAAGLSCIQVMPNKYCTKQ